MAGLTEVTSDLLKAAGKVGVRELINNINNRLSREGIPEDWISSTTIPIFTDTKEDTMESGKHREAWLLEHGRKVYKSV